MLSEAAAKVCGLVLGDNVLTAETVEELSNLVVSGGRFLLVVHFADATHGIAGSLGPITILQATSLSLADSL